MANGPFDRFDAFLARDARLAAARRRLPAAAGTGDWPMAERAARAAASAAVRRALIHALRGLLSGPRVALAARRTGPVARPSDRRAGRAARAGEVRPASSKPSLMPRCPAALAPALATRRPRTARSRTAAGASRPAASSGTGKLSTVTHASASAAWAQGGSAGPVEVPGEERAQARRGQPLGPGRTGRRGLPISPQDGPTRLGGVVADTAAA
jgi:hypothetical protein